MMGDNGFTFLRRFVAKSVGSFDNWLGFTFSLKKACAYSTQAFNALSKFLILLNKLFLLFDSYKYSYKKIGANQIILKFQMNRLFA